MTLVKTIYRNYEIHRIAMFLAMVKAFFPGSSPLVRSNLPSFGILVAAYPLQQGLLSLQTLRQSSAEPCGDTRTSTMESRFHIVALEHLDELFGYAMSLTRSKSDAEDLVQETYLRASRAHTRLAPGSKVRSWLYTILRNTFFNQIRRRRSGPPIVDLDDESGHVTPVADESAVDPLTSYLTAERKRDVRQAIDSLPDTFREVIVLREFQDLSYQEIAEVLQCPVGTVMSRLGRARDKLRETLQHLSQEAAF